MVCRAEDRLPRPLGQPQALLQPCQSHWRPPPAGQPERGQSSPLAWASCALWWGTPVYEGTVAPAPYASFPTCSVWPSPRAPQPRAVGMPLAKHVFSQSAFESRWGWPLPWDFAEGLRKQPASSYILPPPFFLKKNLFIAVKYTQSDRSNRFRCTAQWRRVHAHCRVAVTTITSRTFSPSQTETVAIKLSFPGLPPALPPASCLCRSDPSGDLP